MAASVIVVALAIAVWGIAAALVVQVWAIAADSAAITVSTIAVAWETAATLEIAAVLAEAIASATGGWATDQGIAGALVALVAANRAPAAIAARPA